MRITSSGNLPISVLFAVGAVKTAYDYKKAPEKDKKNVFIRNTVIIGSSIAGVLGAQKYADKLIQKRPLKRFTYKLTKGFKDLPKPNFIKRMLNPLLDANHDKKVDFIEEVTECDKIIQNCAKDCFIVSSAIIAGIISGEILNRTLFKHSKAATPLHTDLKTLKPNYNVAANPDEGFDKISRVLQGDFRILEGVDQPMAVLDALSISQEKNTETKMKMTAYELIANALTPTFFISLAMSFTKNLKCISRIPIVTAFGGLGLAIGHQLAQQFNRSVTPEIAENLQELKENLTENFQ